MKTQLIQNLDWEVKTQPVLYNVNGQIMKDNNYIHLSKSNGQPLAVMGKKYMPLYVEDFKKNVEILQEISGYSLNGYQEFKGGRIILAVLQSADNSTQATIPSLEYIVVGNSFNGMHPFFVGNSTFLIRCENAFSQIHMFDVIRHTKSLPRKIEELQVVFTTYLKNQKLLHSNFEKMDLVKVTQKEKEEYARLVLNISPNNEISTITQNRLNNLIQSIDRETSAVGNTVFGMFQGVTHYTTHLLNQKEEVFGNIFGTKNNYNQRAYKQALQLVA